MRQPDTKRVLLSSFFEGNRLPFALALVFSLLSAGCNLFVSWLLGAVVHAVTLMALTKAHFIHRGLRQYKDRAFSLLTRKSIAEFTTENTGTYLSALTNDASSVETNYLNAVVLMVYWALMFCMTLAMMLWYNPLLTLIVIG